MSMFPTHKILPADQDSWLTKAMDQKLIEFTPNSFCSFFQNIEVLQVQGIASKEYFFGTYFNEKYCGHIYLGNKYTPKEVTELCEIYMPENIAQLQDYVLNNCEKVWYVRPTLDQYAWVFDRVLTKVV